MLEGLMEVNKSNSLIEIENELKARLHKLLNDNELNKKILPLYQRLAVAASILLVIGFTIFMLTRTQSPEKSLAENTYKTTPVETKTAPPEKVTEQSKFRQETKTKKIESKLNTGVSKEESIYKEMEDKPASKPAPVMEISDSAVSLDYAMAQEDIMELKVAEVDSYDDSRKIKGKVTDSNGGPLPGVNIVVKGTNTGTVSDINGEFSMNIKDTSDVLTFSYIGYKSAEMPIDKDNINLALEEEVTALNEVVVVGYGSQKKSDVTGSISSPEKYDARKSRAAKSQVNRELSDSENDEVLILKSSVEKALKNNDKANALTNLKILYSKITAEDVRKEINEIIELVNGEKFEKALKKLKKL